MKNNKKKLILSEAGWRVQPGDGIEDQCYGDGQIAAKSVKILTL